MLEHSHTQTHTHANTHKCSHFIRKGHTNITLFPPPPLKTTHTCTHNNHNHKIRNRVSLPCRCAHLSLQRGLLPMLISCFPPLCMHPSLGVVHVRSINSSSGHLQRSCRRCVRFHCARESCRRVYVGLARTEAVLRI